MDPKKGFATVTLIFSILITIVAITLMLLLASNSTGVGKQYYCKSLYRVRTLYNYRDPYCEQLKQLTYTQAEKQVVKITQFYGQHDQQAIHLRSRGVIEQYPLEVPAYAELNNASFAVSVPESSQVRQFSDGEIYQSILLQGVSDTQTIYFEIPRNAVVNDIEFEVSGRSTPALADMVFLIDTSGSMANEWAVLCTNLKLLQNTLDDIGVNSTFSIYGIASGGTHGKCQQAIVSQQEMETEFRGMYHRQMGLWYCQDGRNFNDKPLCDMIYTNNPFDSYDEAWGTATLWLMRHYSGWRDDAKRIIFPISDSDPTGGGQTLMNRQSNVNPYPEPAQLSGSGTEDAVIDAIIEKYNTQRIKTHIFPIYGDKSTIPKEDEGYYLGIPEEECTKKTPCKEVLNMMRRVADATEGSVSPYNDLVSLRDSIIDAITLPYPEQVTVKVVGKRVFQSSQPLDETPNIVQDAQLASAIQTYIASNCDQDTCKIPITITSATQGVVWIDKLRVSYTQPMSGVKVDLEGHPLVTIPSLTHQSTLQPIDFTEELKKKLVSCTTPSCEFSLDFTANTIGTILLSQLDIQYSYYPIEEQLLTAILDCWILSGYGKSTQNHLCKELVIPQEYRFAEPITEKSISDEFIERNICHLIENVDNNCGHKDNFRLAKEINTPQNILVEYKADSSQIVVS
ncbi:hypothetical protein KY320_03230 [Candidatus Woesearchaeota archaeon]|nr:hypothetical protein [Candidatus Woesearchaeota archaeon]